MNMILVALLMMLASSLWGQNAEEWTQQKKTQRRYLLQQIAGLKVYLDYAQKGVQVAQQGLHTIGRIKRGDFDLHEAFFKGLGNVNPTIARSAVVAAVLARGVQIAQDVQKTRVWLRGSLAFSPEEVTTFRILLEEVITRTAEAIEELVRLTRNNEYEMSDEGRLRRIERAAQEMEGHYVFFREQASRFRLLFLQRTAEAVDLNVSKQIYRKP